ncbi:MAG: hypothetical protein H6R10_3466 [Rhodocyclaceae bacterium]|nr:hypothetical protein [Rhodocyclaceae bacterium]
MMKRLQSLLDRLVAISRYEAMLRSRAQVIFGKPEQEMALLETPTCWRRPPRVRGGIASQA